MKHQYSTVQYTTVNNAPIPLVVLSYLSITTNDDFESIVTIHNVEIEGSTNKETSDEQIIIQGRLHSKKSIEPRPEVIPCTLNFPPIVTTGHHIPILMVESSI